MEKVKDLFVSCLVWVNHRTSGNYYFYKNSSGDIVVHSCRTNGIFFYTRDEFLKWYF